MKVVHVYRDGRDEAVSAWDFNNTLSQGAFRESYPQFADYARAFGVNWANAIHASKGFERAHRDRCFHVRAEDLQGDTAAALAPLLAFLGVDVGAGVIKGCTDAAWDAAPLDVDPGVWKKTFDDASAKYYTREYGELLKLLGYAEA
jgi:hypothetical protein